MTQHDAYAAWRLPAFRRYFSGNMILIVGWQMQKVAIGFEISSMAGPAIGGLLIGFFQSPTLVYTINAIGQLTFVVLLGSIVYKHQQAPRQPLTLQSFSAGLRFVRKQKVVLSAMLLDMFG